MWYNRKVASYFIRKRGLKLIGLDYFKGLPHGVHAPCGFSLPKQYLMQSALGRETEILIIERLL